MIDVAIIMTTCPRKDSTIEESKKSLIDSMSGDSFFQISNDYDKSYGCFRNYDKALRMAIDADKEFVLVVPDDMIYIKGWMDVASKFKWKRLGYFALYTPKGLGNRFNFKPGTNEVTGGWASSWGGCYLMKTEVAKQVVDHPFYQKHLNGELDPKRYLNYAFNKRIDHCIPEVIHKLGLRQIFYAPSICTHIGFTSTLGHKHTKHEDAFR